MRQEWTHNTGDQYIIIIMYMYITDTHTLDELSQQILFYSKVLKQLFEKTSYNEQLVHMYIT